MKSTNREQTFCTKVGGGVTSAPLMTDDLNKQVFATEAQYDLDPRRQPLSHERLLFAWERAMGPVMRKIRRNRKTIRSRVLPLWQEFEPDLKQFAMYRAWAMIAAGCFEPDGRKLTVLWPENRPAGSNTRPLLSPLTTSAWLILLRMDELIRSELADRDSEYWEATNCTCGTFPELFAYYAAEACERLGQP